MSCAKPDCNKTTSSYKLCTGCSNAYHTLCGEFSTFKDKTKPGDRIYICSACVSNPDKTVGLVLAYQSRSNSNSSQSSVKRKALDLDGADDIHSPQASEIDTAAILDAIQKSSQETQARVSGLTEEVHGFNENLNVRCNQIESSVAALRLDVTEIQADHQNQIDSLKDEIRQLKSECNKEVFIHGYENADAPDLDPVVAAINIASKIGFDLQEDHIQRARVIKSKPRISTPPQTSSLNRPPIIALVFFDHSTAERMVNAKKRFKKLLNKDVLDSMSDRPISISFSLDKETYELLKETKVRAARHNYKYVWNSNGVVFIRREDGARAIKVSNIRQLDSLMPPCQSSPMDTSHPDQLSSQPRRK